METNKKLNFDNPNYLYKMIKLHLKFFDDQFREVIAYHEQEHDTGLALSRFVYFLKKQVDMVNESLAMATIMQKAFIEEEELIEQKEKPAQRKNFDETVAEIKKAINEIKEQERNKNNV
ncbi:MAG: hypothetical protein RLY43_567 [Bacteroidota bacterium]|jgi:hypothetical protein